MRTTEQHEQQYCEAAEERKDSQQKSKKVEKEPRKGQVAKASVDSEKREGSQSSNKQGQGPQCRNCHRLMVVQ